MTQWHPIEALPKDKNILGRGVLITWYDPENVYEDGTWGPEAIEFTYGPCGMRDGKYGWWNMNSGNIMWFREPPTHWAPLPSGP